MPLSEYMYPVAIAFKMTEQINEPALNFALSLSIPPQKLFP